jgi:hypothetical protein
VPAVRRFIDFVADALPRAMHASDAAIKARAMADAGAKLPAPEAAMEAGA